MNEVLFRIIARVLLATIFIQASVLPAQATAAVMDIHGVDHTWAHHASMISSNWIWVNATLNGGSATNPEPVYVPKDNWAEIADGPWNATNGTDRRMLYGKAWMNAANVSAGKSMQDGFDYSSRKIPPGGSYSQVFAAYDPVNAKARIIVQKVEKGMDNRVHVYVADFTPYHGMAWRAARYYLTPNELTNDIVAGNNPFRMFEAVDISNGMEAQATDPLFNDISFQGVQVAVGHAMQHYKAAFGLIYIPDTRFDQNQSCSSGFFTKKCTTTVKGFAKPKWYLAVPKDMDSTPMEAAICVLPTVAGASCDAAEHVAWSGISVREWKGGNLPIDEQLLYQWSTSKSGFSMLGIGILLAIVTMGAALAVGMPLMGVEAGVTTAGEEIAGQIGAGSLASMVGGTYVVGSGVLADKSPTDYQNGLFGQIGDGQLAPNLGALGEQAQGLAAAVAPKMDAGIIGDTLDGAKRMAYGDCEGNAGAQCNAADPGIAPRTNSYRQQNIPLQLWDARKQCEMAGNMGAALDRCTARMENLRSDQEQQQQ